MQSLSNEVFEECLVKKTKCPKGADQFDNETKLLAFFKGSYHPHIAEYYCKLEDTPFKSEAIYVRHYEESLGGIKSVISVDKRLEITYQISKVLTFLSYRKICHRDLKMDNIMLDRHLSARVIDWGSACKMFSLDKDAGGLKVKNEARTFIISFSVLDGRLFPAILRGCLLWAFRQALYEGVNLERVVFWRLQFWVYCGKAVLPSRFGGHFLGGVWNGVPQQEVSRKESRWSVVGFRVGNLPEYGTEEMEEASKVRSFFFSLFGWLSWSIYLNLFSFWFCLISFIWTNRSEGIQWIESFYFRVKIWFIFMKIEFVWQSIWALS